MIVKNKVGSSSILVPFLIILVLSLACSSIGIGNQNKTGTITDVHLGNSMDISDSTIDKTNILGYVGVQLADGSKVNALWDISTIQQVMIGMQIEIRPTKDPNYWQIVRIIKSP